jgi:hypothetical protein
MRTRHASRIDRDGDYVAAEPYNPSIIDFAVDLLRHSPEDVRQLARACVYFEQAYWLHSITTVDPRPALIAEAAGEVEAALQRTYVAVGMFPVRVTLGPSSWTYRDPGAADLDQRLLSILRATRMDPRLGIWWRETFEARVTEWTEGRGEPESVMSLIHTLREDDGVDLVRAAEAAKNVLVQSEGYAQGLDWLVTLREKFPEVVEAGEWEDYVEEFRSWARDNLLNSADEMMNLEELHLVDRLAGVCGVAIDDELWAKAEGIVEKNEAQAEAEVGWGPEPNPDFIAALLGKDVHGEELEIEAIFTMLAE